MVGAPFVNLYMCNVSGLWDSLILCHMLSSQDALDEYNKLKDYKRVRKAHYIQ